MNEYKSQCDKCLDSGSDTFARIYPIRIKHGSWKWLCKKCWNLNK